MFAGFTSRCTMRSLCAAIERVGNLRPKIDQTIGLQWTLADRLRQHLPVVHLHRKEVTPIVLADFVDRADIGMVQAGNRARFG